MAAGAQAADTRPNILLLLADDWSWQPEDQKDRFELALPTFARVRREEALDDADVRLVRRALGAQPGVAAQRAQAGLVGDVADERGEEGPGAGRDELLFRLVKKDLALVQQEQPRRLARRDLAAG